MLGNLHFNTEWSQCSHTVGWFVFTIRGVIPEPPLQSHHLATAKEKSHSRSSGFPGVFEKLHHHSWASQHKARGHCPSLAWWANSWWAWQGTTEAAAQARDHRPPAANDPENRVALTWFLKSTQTKHLHIHCFNSSNGTLPLLQKRTGHMAPLKISSEVLVATAVLSPLLFQVSFFQGYITQVSAITNIFANSHETARNLGHSEMD